LIGKIYFLSEPIPDDSTYASMWLQWLRCGWSRV